MFTRLNNGVSGCFPPVTRLNNGVAACLLDLLMVSRDVDLWSLGMFTRLNKGVAGCLLD